MNTYNSETIKTSAVKFGINMSYNFTQKNDVL